jgi:hypothetical protein
MVRFFCILAAGLFVGSSARGDELGPRLRIVLVHGTEAEHWLVCLGKGCVQVESLIPSPSEGDEWVAAERQVRRLVLPDAFVTCHCADDMLDRFWSDRFGNQGRIEIVTLESSHAVHRLEQERRCIQKVHSLLVKLCPERKAVLDERMRAELLRRQPVIALNEPLARR